MSRLQEPSTWAGLATFGQMLAAIFPQYAWAGHLVTAIGGSAAVALQEKNAAP